MVGVHGPGFFTAYIGATQQIDDITEDIISKKTICRPERGGDILAVLLGRVQYTSPFARDVIHQQQQKRRQSAAPRLRKRRQLSLIVVDKFHL